MTDGSTRPRKPWIAAVLSLFCTGLGHLYCGRVARGVTLFLLALLFVPAFLVASRLPPSTPLLAVLVACLLLTLAVYVFAVIDAVRIARRRPEGATLPAWIVPSVYALGIVLGLAAPVGGMLLLRGVAFQAFRIPMGSMAPAVVPGDRVLVNKLAYDWGTPKRYEVVVFRNPQDRNVRYIKRVIGLPGDRVEVRDGRILINGEPLPEEPEDLRTDGLDETVVPEDCYFVLGDARDNSRDSRHFGCVPAADLVGRVEYVLLPPSRFGRFEGDGR